MKSESILRLFCFILFFTIGLGGLGVSILCDDLLLYYQNKQVLADSEKTLEKLKGLNEDYDVLLGQIKNDSNFVDRIATITLGTKAKSDPNTAYPQVKAELLDSARKAISEEKGSSDTNKLPAWLERCSDSKRRTALFLAAMFLILVSFMFFGSRGKDIDITLKTED